MNVKRSDKLAFFWIISFVVGVLLLLVLPRDDSDSVKTTLSLNLRTWQFSLGQKGLAFDTNMHKFGATTVSHIGPFSIRRFKTYTNFPSLLQTPPKPKMILSDPDGRFKVNS